MSPNPMLLMSRTPLDQELLRDCLWVDQVRTGTFWHPAVTWVGAMEVDIVADYFDHGFGRDKPREPKPRKLMPRYGTAADWPFVLRFDYRSSWSDVLVAMITRLHGWAHAIDPAARLMLVDDGTHLVFIDEGTRTTMDRSTRRVQYLPRKPWAVPRTLLGGEQVSFTTTPVDLILATAGDAPAMRRRLHAWCRQVDSDEPLPPLLRLGPMEFRVNAPNITFGDPRWTWTLAMTFPQDHALTVFEIVRSLLDVCDTAGVDAVVLDRHGTCLGRLSLGARGMNSKLLTDFAAADRQTFAERLDFAELEVLLV